MECINIFFWMLKVTKRWVSLTEASKMPQNDNLAAMCNHPSGSAIEIEKKQVMYRSMVATNLCVQQFFFTFSTQNPYFPTIRSHPRKNHHPPQG